MDLINTLKELKNFRKTGVPYHSKSSAWKSFVRNSQEKVRSSSNGSVRFGENHQSDRSILIRFRLWSHMQGVRRSW